MFSPHHTTGFYYAPVSKVALGAVMGTSVALTVPLSDYRYIFLAPASTIKQPAQISRFFYRRFFFLDPKDLLLASMLLYHFRIFERRYGSQKFSSFLLATFLLSVLLEILVMTLLTHFNITMEPTPTGPYGVIFALFVPYFCDIPRVAMTHFLSIPVTGKSITYIIGLQMLSGSVESALLAGCGVLAGLWYRYNLLWVRHWLVVPSALSSLFSGSLGELIKTAPPINIDKPMGATLEIQREQQIELLEQQMVWAQLQQQRPRRPSRGDNRNGFGFGLFGGGGQNDNIQDPQPQADPGPPGEDQVSRLVEMGFSRDSVLNALQQTHNDVTEATNILLTQS